MALTVRPVLKAGLMDLKTLREFLQAAGSASAAAGAFPVMPCQNELQGDLPELRNSPVLVSMAIPSCGGVAGGHDAPTLNLHQAKPAP